MCDLVRAVMRSIRKSSVITFISVSSKAMTSNRYDGGDFPFSNLRSLHNFNKRISRLVETDNGFIFFT